MAEGKVRSSAVAFLIVFLAAMGPVVCLAYEREINLGEEASQKAQAKKDEVRFLDRLRLEIGMGWGVDYNQTAIVSGLFELSPAYASYLSRLGLDFSEAELSFNASAAISLHPRLGVYVGAPFGVVQKKKDTTSLSALLEEEEYDFGIGDIHGGLYGQVVTEGSWRPGVALSVDANSDLAKYSSLGDGVWDFTPAVRVQKTIYGPAYLFGAGDYTYKLEKSGVKPGDVIGYGGGLGLRIESEQPTTFEVGLKRYTIDETTIDGVFALEKNHDLVLTVDIRALWKGLGASAYLGGLDKKVDFKSNNYWGFMFSWAF